MSLTEILLFAILVALFTVIYVLLNLWGDFNYWQYRQRSEKFKSLKGERYEKENIKELTEKFEQGSTFARVFSIGFLLALIFSGAFVYILKLFN